MKTIVLAFPIAVALLGCGSAPSPRGSTGDPESIHARATREFLAGRPESARGLFEAAIDEDRRAVTVRDLGEANLFRGDRIRYSTLGIGVCRLAEGDPANAAGAFAEVARPRVEIPEHLYTRHFYRAYAWIGLRACHERAGDRERAGEAERQATIEAKEHLKALMSLVHERLPDEWMRPEQLFGGAPLPPHAPFTHEDLEEVRAAGGPYHYEDEFEAAEDLLDE